MAIICISLLLLLWFSCFKEEKSREMDIHEAELRLLDLKYNIEMAKISEEASARSAVKITEEVSRKWKP